MKFFKQWAVIVALGCCMSVYAETQPTSAVTYLFNGRFGDRMVTYYKAKLLAHAYDLPLLYKRPPYGEGLVMDVAEEQRFDEGDVKKRFERVVTFHRNFDYKKKQDQWAVKRDNATLYVVSLFTPLEKLGVAETVKDDPVFLQKLQQMISPRFPLQNIFRPHDQITVAVHVRKGGGADWPLLSKATRKVHYADVQWPLKFPPNEFYIDQLKRLAAMYDKKPMYVHIFTDDPNPQYFIDLFKAALTDVPITFAARQAGNAHNSNVLDDFFGMMSFDCLIRPTSSFTQMVELMGNHQVVIYPTKSHWEGEKLIIDDVRVIDKRKCFPS